jgi:hypothetical protein
MYPCGKSKFLRQLTIKLPSTLRKTYGNLKSHQVKLNLFVWNPTTNFKRMKGHYVAKRGRQQRTLTEKLCFRRAVMKKWPFTTCWNLPLNMDAYLLTKMSRNNDSNSILYWRENTVWKSSNRSRSFRGREKLRERAVQPAVMRASDFWQERARELKPSTYSRRSQGKFFFVQRYLAVKYRTTWQNPYFFIFKTPSRVIDAWSVLGCVGFPIPV